MRSTPFAASWCIVCGLTALLGCGGGSADGPPVSRAAAPAAAPTAAPPATQDLTGRLMEAGLQALHQKQDYDAAIAVFRLVLAQNATHYGAHYQLATALDRAGRPAEARPIWEAVLKMAEQYKDERAVVTARIRLARTNP